MRASGGPALRRHASSDALLLVPLHPSPRPSDRRPHGRLRLIRHRTSVVEHLDWAPGGSAELLPILPTPERRRAVFVVAACLGWDLSIGTEPRVVDNFLWVTADYLDTAQPGSSASACR